jgi:D-xylose 1-dehydrogenase (NADP+, D-xylono-1,5-lactone-forming)
MSKKVKYGILSTARISRDGHIPAAPKTSNSEIIAISSRDINTAKKYASEFGIPKAYGSYDELLANKEIDAIINPLPNSMHCEWTVKAVKAGKHVLNEKPICATVKEVDIIIKEAGNNKVLVMEAFTQRFRSEIRFIKKLLESGKMGRVMKMNSELLVPIGDWVNDVRVIKELGGGVLMDCGCYCISLTRYLMGKEPACVQAFQNIRLPNNVDSTFMGIMKFKDNALVSFTVSQEMPFKVPLEIVTEKGYIYLSNYFFDTKVLYNIDGVDYTEEFKEEDRFALQMEHFSDCILNGKTPEFTLQDARLNMVLLEALRKAAEEQKAVCL